MGGTVEYCTFVTSVRFVPGPTWSELPLAASVVTASQEAEAAGVPRPTMRLSGWFFRASRMP